MTKRLTSRILAFVLCVAMCFTCLQASATALSPNDVNEFFNKFAHYTVNELPQSLRRHLNSGWSRTTLDNSDSEWINVLTTVDADGTKTLYAYDSPIKYVDDDGYLRFIDSSLKPCIKADGLFDWYSYKNTANDIKTYFPLFIGTGVLIECETGNIRITPRNARISSSSRINVDNTEYVMYEKVFDENTHIRYTAINKGVKEDIILESYNGNNTFEYIVETEELTPIRSTGKKIEFFDGNLNTAYTFGEIVLFDSAETPATNSNNYYTIEELDDGKYLVTLVIDEDFLTDESTVYPVVIDPEIAAVKRSTSSTQFKATTYKSDGSVSTTDNEIACTQTEVTAITHLQAPDLSAFAHINPKEIEQAQLTLNFKTGGNGYVYADGHNFATDPSTVVSSLNWDEVKRRCTSQTDSFAQINSSAQISITDIFISWMTAYTKSYHREDNISPEDGLFLYALPDNSGVVNATLCSPGTENAPSVSVRYTVDQALLPSGYYYIQSGYYHDDARYMTATSNGAELRDLNKADPNQIWYVKRVDEVYGQNIGMYYIYSVGTAKNDYLKASGNTTIEWRNESSVPAGLGDGTCFYIVEQTDRYHRVLTASNKAVAAKNYNKENGTPIVQEKVKGLDNQRWEFELADYGVFAKGDTNISGVVGENVLIKYSMAPVDAIYTIDIKEQEIAEVAAKDSHQAYIKCKAVGSATITVSFSMESPITGLDEPYMCKWYLSVEPPSITLSDNYIELNVGETRNLYANIRPKSMSVICTSSDENVATYNLQTGELVAVGVGETTITVSANDENLTDSCKVVVSELVIIEKDNEYSNVIFNDGKIWKITAFDYNSVSQTNIPRDGYRSNYNIQIDYTIRQLGLLYKIDPNGVTHYVQNKTFGDKTTNLCYKDDVFTEIFGRTPQYYQLAGGELYPMIYNSERHERIDYYSEAEFLFGTVSRATLENIASAFIEFALVEILETLLVDEILDAAGFVSEYGTTYPICDLVTACYFTGAIDGAANAAANYYISNLLTKTIDSDLVSDLFGWAIDAIELVSNIYETALPSCVTKAHIAIYENVSQNDSSYVIKLSDNNKIVSLNEFIEHYNNLLEV